VDEVVDAALKLELRIDLGVELNAQVPVGCNGPTLGYG
jgi:hypothetical protein